MKWDQDRDVTISITTITMNDKPGSGPTSQEALNTQSSEARWEECLTTAQDPPIRALIVQHRDSDLSELTAAMANIEGQAFIKDSGEQNIKMMGHGSAYAVAIGVGRWKVAEREKLDIPTSPIVLGKIPE